MVAPRHTAALGARGEVALPHVAPPRHRPGKVNHSAVVPMRPREPLLGYDALVHPTCVHHSGRCDAPSRRGLSGQMGPPPGAVPVEERRPEADPRAEPDCRLRMRAQAARHCGGSVSVREARCAIEAGRDSASEVLHADGQSRHEGPAPRHLLQRGSSGPTTEPMSPTFAVIAEGPVRLRRDPLAGAAGPLAVRPAT